MSFKTRIARQVRRAGGDRVIDSRIVRRVFRAPMYRKYFQEKPITRSSSSRTAPAARPRGGETTGPPSSTGTAASAGRHKETRVGPLLSVIVPAYNVECYLGACLSSVVEQSHKNLEIIIVDDGSSDSTGRIADEIAAEDARVRVIHKENAGLGAARNSGLAAATGDYVTFVDSDDEVPVRAYERMVSVLEKSGSDAASGAICRYNSQREWVPDWVKEVHGEHREGVRGKDFPEIFWDLFVCNKIFRRDSWDKYVGEFPEGVLYEDQECTAKMFAKGAAFDLLEDCVYRWRLRDDGSSITQNKSSVDDLVQRMDVARTVQPVIESSREPALIDYWYSKLLCEDLFYYYREVPRALPEFWDALVEGVREFYRDDRDYTFSRWPLERRLMVLALVRDDKNAFYRVLLDSQERGTRARTIHDGATYKQWVPAVDEFLDPVPDSLLTLKDADAVDSEAIVSQVEYIPGGGLRVTGWTYFQGVDPEPNRLLSAYLQGKDVGNARDVRIPVDVERESLPEADSVAGDPYTSYADAGFILSISEKMVSEVAQYSTSTQGDTFELHLRLAESGIDRDVTVRRVLTNGTGGSLRASVLQEDGARLVPEVLRPGFGFRALTPRFVAEDILVDKGIIRGRIRLNNPLPVQVVDRFLSGPLKLVVVQGADTLVEGAMSAVDGGSRHAWDFCLRLPERHNFGSSKNTQNFLLEVRGGDGEGPRAPVAVKDVATIDFNAQKFALTATPYGYAEIQDVNQHGSVDRIELIGGDTQVLLAGAVYLDGAEIRQTTPSFALVGKTRNLYPASLSFDALRGRYEVVFDLFEEDIDGRRVSVGSQGYIFEILTATGRKLPASVWLRRSAELDAQLPLKRFVGNTRVIFMSAGRHGLSIQVGAAIGSDSSGSLAQYQHAKNNFGGKARRIEDAAFFESFGGRGVTDTPKRLDKYLAAHHPEIPRYWSVRDGSVAVPEGAIALTAYSKEWYEHLSRSRYLINNNNFPYYFRKDPDQVYIQTWHGTPLKRIGNHVPSGNLSLSYRQLMLREVNYWDYLVAQSPWAAPILSDAFGFSGETIALGYPRNDSLLQGDVSEYRRCKVRRHLGIGDGQLTVLYAPTWRDDKKAANGHYAQTLYLDYNEFRKRYGKDVVILQRGHINTAFAQTERYPSNVVDVNRYSDINDLYLAADILVTDYSSVMFDYVVTAKPIVYLAPDLAHYRDVTRGFYFDFERTAPGPIVSTTREVIEVIDSMSSVQRKYSEKYEKFLTRFAPLDDGYAGERVGDRFFN